MKQTLMLALAFASGCVAAASAVSLDGSWRLDCRGDEANDARHPVCGKAPFTDVAMGKVVFSKPFEIAPNGKVELGDLAVEGLGALTIDYEVDGKPFRNYFICGEPPFDLKQVKEWMK